MSVDNIQRLHNLTSREQHIHWGSPRPWEHAGGRVMLPKPDFAGRIDVSVDLAGNVTRIRVPVLRPCFGSPTAFLVHGGDQTRSGRNGKHPTRCNACPAKEACAKVGYARLHADDRIAVAYDAFEAAGGRPIFIKGRHSSGNTEIKRRYAQVLAALIAHPPFASVNDANIQAYCDDMIAERQVKEQERQRLKRERERAARIRQGEFDAAFLERMFGERVYRQSLFDQAKLESCVPAFLKRTGPDGGKFASRVWYLEALLLASGQKSNPSVIATALIERGWVASENQNSLRGRVGDALVRIRLLEKFVLPGRACPVWEKLNMKDVMASGAASV